MTESTPVDPRRDADDPDDPPPGPTDHGREGGMATREVAPDVVKRSEPN